MPQASAQKGKKLTMRGGLVLAQKGRNLQISDKGYYIEKILGI